jgi:UPF0755 protein
MKSRRPRAGGCLFRLVLFCTLIVLLAIGAAAWSLSTPYQGFQTDVFLEIPHGTTSGAMATQLQKAGVIQYRWQFLLARVLRPSSRLQAGEYRFDHPASVWSVFDRIVRGDVFYYELTIPEGSNIFDIAGIVAQLGFLKSADFLRVARDPSLIHDLAPRASTLEGYLFPSTYRLTRPTTAHQLCRMMTDLFRRRWQELKKPPDTPPVHDVVTLASLIEKETGVPEERGLVASVYKNRLRLGMRLACDPTTIYAALLEGRYRGVIHQSDLDSTNPYNTYQHAGLPPGAIASPGLASLQAALFSAETEYLYFVARPDGSGGHHFSKTGAEHERAVQEYRHGSSNANQGSPAPRSAPAPERRHRR